MPAAGRAGGGLESFIMPIPPQAWPSKPRLSCSKPSVFAPDAADGDHCGEFACEKKMMVRLVGAALAVAAAPASATESAAGQGMLSSNPWWCQETR